MIVSTPPIVTPLTVKRCIEFALILHLHEKGAQEKDIITELEHIIKVCSRYRSSSVAHLLLQNIPTTSLDLSFDAIKSGLQTALQEIEETQRLMSSSLTPQEPGQELTVSEQSEPRYVYLPRTPSDPTGITLRVSKVQLRTLRPHLLNGDFQSGFLLSCILTCSKGGDNGGYILGRIKPSYWLNRYSCTGTRERQKYVGYPS